MTIQNAINKQWSTFYFGLIHSNLVTPWPWTRLRPVFITWTCDSGSKTGPDFPKLFFQRNLASVTFLHLITSKFCNASWRFAG